jgi:predicted NUDIX family phosphoesterase
MGAMENWGLVTYRTTAVLFDEGKSDNRYKNRIAYVVAHGESSVLVSRHYNQGHISDMV